MENIVIKQEPSDQESSKTEVSNSFQRTDYIKVEPEDGSDPKLIIENCETCETSIEPRLEAIKQERTCTSKLVVKIEPNEVISESIYIKTCNSPASTSSKCSKSMLTLARFPDVSNVKDNNSPAKPVKWKRITFDDLKRSDSPSLSSQKDSFTPYLPRKSFNNNRSWKSSSQYNYQRSMYHPYQNYHDNFHNSSNNYYHNRHKPWNNFSQQKRINKENDYIVKNEEKPENALRIIKITPLNNNTQEKVCANTLKEQNHPPADRPSTSSTLATQSSNSHTDSSTKLDTIHLGKESSNNFTLNNEVNNNVIIQQHKENDNESVSDINECKVNDLQDTNCVQDLFEIEDVKTGESREKSSNRSAKISTTLNKSYETEKDCRNVCSNDETSSSDSCFTLSNANDPEAKQLIDKVHKSKYNIENVEKSTESFKDMQSNEDGVKETNIIVKDTESNNGRKEVEIDVQDAGVEEMLRDLEIEYEVINEFEDSNLPEDETKIVGELQGNHAEVEVVKEISCDTEIECVFSKVKEAHLCVKCFVDKRKRKRNKDTDIIFLKKKITKKNIPVISIEETEG